MTAPGLQDTTADDARPGEKVDVRNLQDKFHDLLDQRNSYNDLAREARDARNLLNEQRRERAEQLDALKKTRDDANTHMQEHKLRRNAYQDQAKALIAQKRGQRGAIERSLPLQVRKMRNDIEVSIERQQTQVLSIEKERDLVDNLRKMRKELTRLEAELAKQKTIEVSMDDTDQAIDQLFAQADEEHAQVVHWNKTAREHHDKFVTTIKELRVVQSESNEKHQEFLAFRVKADEFHQKAMELREKVMAVRAERRDEFQRRRGEIRDVNDAAHRAVGDPRAIEKANEDALAALKKGGKISLGF
jgi:uncharacterized coiled-coil DUF342 family protein